MSNTFATNASANSAVSYLQRNSAWQSSSISKLSSGSRIVKASDDAASLAVGTKLKADVTALKQASANASQAASMLQVADGAMSRISDTLMRMKSLATQANTDSLTNTERGYLDEEFQAMADQIDYIASSTKFNDNAIVSGAMGTTFTTGGTNDILGNGSADIEAIGGTADGDVFHLSSNGTNDTITLLNNTTGASETVKIASVDADVDETVKFESLGVAITFNNANLGTDLVAAENTATVAHDASGEGAATFQVGVAAGDTVTMNLKDSSASGLSVSGDVTSKANAASAQSALDSAIEEVNNRRADLGAYMSRLEKINENIATTVENLDAARSTLMDVDVAEEMTKFSTNQVMTQAATAMLAQANQLPQNLMRLLQ